MASLSTRTAPASSSKENQDRKYLPPKPSNREAVKVLVRCRPMSEKEIDNRYKRIVDCEPSKCMIEITNLKIDQEDQKKVFNFDAVFDEMSSQEEVYEHVRPLVASVLAGFNGTIFAYGQTGTGKTYTMEGCLEDPNKHGIILRTFNQIFQHISNSTDQQFFVRSSYLEIYQEEIRDLLSAKAARCEVRESCEKGIFVKDLSSYVSKNVKEITDIMTMGNKNRSTGATDMNEHSSRSHAIFIVTIETLDLLAGEGVRVGKLSLVDLAGSERQGKSGAKGDRFKEATKINLSLSALGKVMAALVEGNSPHVPYRDSKLTRILQDSLGGNSKTIMIANVGPASYNHEETLITLRYAQRAKRIQNEPMVNEDPSYALVQEYKAEIERLRGLLEERRRAVHRRATTPREQKAVDSGGSGGSAEDVRPATGKPRHVVSDEERKRQAEYEEELRRSIAENAQVTQNLEVRIAEMESKLLCGGGGGGGGNRSIFDYTLDQKRALESREQEIRDKKLAEVAMLLELEVQEDVALDRHRSYTSLRQEVEHKASKLRKMIARLRWTKKKIQQAADEFSLDRRDLENEKRVLLKQLKMNHTVIQNVIPVHERVAILERLVYNENLDDWVLRDVVVPSQPLRKRPIATPGCRRPVSEFARSATHIRHQKRYQGENILRLEPDVEQRTTKVYEMPTMNAHVLVELDSALEQEDDLEIDAAPFGRSRSSSVLDSAHFGSSRPSNSGLQHGNYLERFRDRFGNATKEPRYYQN